VNDFEIWYADTFATQQVSQVNESVEGMSVKSSAVPKKRSGSPPRVIRDPGMDEDQEIEQKEREGVDVDNDALAYIRARKNVMTLAQAKKVDRM
jgi:LDH2 family malate/lactate/ureidoglycolate dehydrogenase